MQQTRQLLCQYRHYAQVAAKASLLVDEKQLRKTSDQPYDLPGVAVHHFTQLAGYRSVHFVHVCRFTGHHDVIQSQDLSAFLQQEVSNDATLEEVHQQVSTALVIIEHRHCTHDAQQLCLQEQVLRHGATKGDGPSRKR